MTNNSNMTNSTRNLGYQFYFLFRTRWWKDDQFIQEPYAPGQFGSLGTIGIQIDSDKRLFCRTVPWKNTVEKLANVFENQLAEYFANLRQSLSFSKC